jgi:two-component system, NarL family, nitrate/nitrite response regulator NarL
MSALAPCRSSSARPMTIAKRLTPTTSVSPRGTILLCDDQRLIRARVREILRDLTSLEVIGEAADGRSAVALARELKPDVVLMDISMPGMNGVEATRQIHAQCPAVRVLGFSAESDRDLMRQLRRAGARGYLVKTGNPLELVTTLQKILAGEFCFNLCSGEVDPGPRLD